MKETFLTKAHSANLNIDYTGWFWSRKYNGFSVLWDGGISTKKPVGEIPWGLPRKNETDACLCTGLWTSNSHIIHAPLWWYENLPPIPLQGEAWYNDSKYFASICNSNNIYDHRWNKLKFIVYNYKPYILFKGIEKFKAFIFAEAYRIAYTNKPFKERYKFLKYYFLLKGYNGFILEDQKPVHDTNDLKLSLAHVTKGDGLNWEGIMLVNPNAPYECCRTYNLLKLKPEYDIEVIIEGYIKGTGRHKERLGSLKVSLVWDEKVLSFHGGKKEHVGQKVTFNVGGGLDDYQRTWTYVYEKFPLGKEITIHFNEVGSNGAIPSGRVSNDYF